MEKKRRKRKTAKQTAANRANGKKGGRPPFKLDTQQAKFFDTMCKAGAMERDIAEALGVDINTINALCKREFGMGFTEHRRQKLGAGRASLAAKNYNDIMSSKANECAALKIFYAKNWLGMSDRHDHGFPDGFHGVQVYLPDNGRGSPGGGNSSDE